MSKFALIGHPLGHSMSPLIHEKLFALSGMTDAEYSLLDIDPADLPQKRELLGSLGGLNVTIPHKQAVIPLLDELGESAQRYNSVNCIKNDGGRLTGYNTDCDGFLRSAELLPLGGKVAILGCGGVGRMMAIEAALAGADLYIAVLESDMPLAKQVEKEIKAMKSDARITIVLNTEIPTDVHYELLMNACPVGMYPKTNACPVPDEVIKASGAVFDVIYNPRETLLMQKAKAMGKNAVGGMAMLVWQAVSAHEIWDGDEYTDEEVQSIIDEMEIAVEKDFK